MQRKDDISKSARPSLLSKAEQEEAARSRILSTLESGPAKNGAGNTGATNRKGWILGLAVLVLAAGGGLWALQQDGEPEPVTAGSERSVAVTQLGAPEPTAATDGVPQEDGPVSAAIIQEDHAAQQAHAGQESLQAMLDTPAPVPAATGAPSAAVGDGNVLSQALESPAGMAAGGAAAAAATATAVVAAKSAPKPKPKPKPKAKPAKSEPKQAETTPEQEKDVLLLSALMAHANAGEHEAAPQPAKQSAKKPRPSLNEQLAQCDKLGKNKAAQCRARVCDGRPNTGACKVRR